MKFPKVKDENVPTKVERIFLQLKHFQALELFKKKAQMITHFIIFKPNIQIKISRLLKFRNVHKFHAINIRKERDKEISLIQRKARDITKRRKSRQTEQNNIAEINPNI